MKIVVTGATGFLGNHIVSEAEKQGHKIFALRHSAIDVSPKALKDFAPDVLVHCGWGGISASDRNNPDIQAENVGISKKIINLYPFKQIIGLGSQDEYGYINSVVDENQPLQPLSEYAKAKIEVCNYLRNYAERLNISWQWLRIFNMYGPGQAPNWLIPSIIKKCITGEKNMQTTLGEQQYAYLYVDDFAQAIVSMFGQKTKNGIFNISSSNPQPLRLIFEQIKMLTNASIEFEFGAIPYRPNQSMMICGDSSKFKASFGDYEMTNFETGLQIVIDEWKRKGMIT